MPSKRPKKSPTPAESTTGPQRLQRVMAASGVGSRRECELIIQEGRVEVDGEIIVTLGVKVDPAKQKIFVDGERLVAEKLQYFMLNKPPGIVSTSNDPSGRMRVIDLIKTEQRVYNVGRLDQSSEGLILVTNDGELANQLTHPRYGVPKKYHVQVAGVPTTEQLRSLEEGVYLAEGKAKATSVKFLRKVKTSSWIEIVLAEGRNREIRRMLAGIDHKVRTLKRVAIGPLKMGDLPVGAHRPLTMYEVKQLKRAAAGLGKTRQHARKKTAKKSTRAKSAESSKTSTSNRTGAPKRGTKTRKSAGARGESQSHSPFGAKKYGSSSSKPKPAGRKGSAKASSKNPTQRGSSKGKSPKGKRR